MAVTKYTYSIEDDTLNGIANIGALNNEISTSAIVTAIDRIESAEDILDVYMKEALSAGDETILDTLVGTHTGEAIEETSLEVDSDGRQIMKSAATKKGWRYLAHTIEIETAKLNGCFSENWQGTARTDFTMQFYNSSDVELTQGGDSDATFQTSLDSNCVKTVVTLKPTHDYDLIGGNIHQHTTPTVNVRIYVIAGAMELGAAGVTEFVSGINLKYMGINEQIATDGRASARLVKTTTGVPYDTNQLRYIIEHPAGHNHEVMVVAEYFRG